ncbi:hypothetical protein IHN63_04300 [Deinococcus sp. 6YEL10]|uniref:hypothetical protein n=1 Tax=Deinococcus sp. 6YEL10 TaxID=2745870 RepID=UPI001E351732|nr:hypothetical protein [Deinococcus sp. 6YEL10]MCD0160523.1 hypothetical protein [Deinococcus sp. 6YEL10]
MSSSLLITPTFLHALRWAAADRQLQLRLRTPADGRADAQPRVGSPPPTLTLMPRPGVLKALAPGASVHRQALPEGALYVGLCQIDSGTDGWPRWRDEWQAVGRLMDRLSELSAWELEALRLQQQPTLGHSDGELVRALRECRAALTPLIIAASPSGSR